MWPYHLKFDSQVLQQILITTVIKSEICIGTFSIGTYHNDRLSQIYVFR